MSEGIDKVRLFLGLVLLAVGLVAFNERAAISEKMTPPAPRAPITTKGTLGFPWVNLDDSEYRERSQKWMNEKAFIKQTVPVVSAIVFFAGLGIAVSSFVGRKPTM